MDWHAHVDIYCERIDASFWAEPLNAISNGAFLIAALVMVLRLRGSGLALGWILTGILAAIGVGSFLFHTYATRWASAADVIPILFFILTYIFLANWRYLRWPWWLSTLGALAFVPFSLALAPIFALFPWLGSSSGYVPVVIILVIYGLGLLRSNPPVAKGILIGAAILSLSLTMRAIDEPLCHLLPIGTHYFWHILNAIMLGWMIEVYRRHNLRELDDQT
ncbi:hypothetical protein TRP8649_03122 [Pelagimonas phthalicica]|uniref:Ceramidase n=1 Tax=Pelagimonas phthalicica TaxID=1037362 RepID=A0A238JFL2_9RHOB|nr:ceramidase domain-containing protein [Pelagimonas phthalicica]TDS91944.1 ceramidase [Pelagimonas phthalicica]SMX28994.1 hypothetical protein TRP8649_03122 [Pelagimonas phthalicica]